MDPKTQRKLSNDIGLANDAAGKEPRRSKRSSRGIGGALRQMEIIQSIQTAPREPRNAETCRIKDTLSQQPENLFAPSKPSRKKGKGPQELIKDVEIPYIPPGPPSSVLPRKRPAGSEKSFGFYDGRDFSHPPFTQPERLSSCHPPSEQDDDDGVEGIAKGVASLSSEDEEMANSQCGEQFDSVQGARRHPETALVDGSDDEPEVLSKRRSTRRQVLDSDDINLHHEARADQAPSPVNLSSSWFQFSEDEDEDACRLLFAKAARSNGEQRNNVDVQAPLSEDKDHGSLFPHPRSELLPETTRSSTPSVNQRGNNANVQTRDGTAGRPDLKASKMPVQQGISKPISSKRPASPPTTIQRKVAKKCSTIASRGRGGSAVAARSRQVSEPHDNSDSEASHDVLFKHHSRNGVPRAPDPVYLDSLASKSQTDGGTGASVAVQNLNTNEVQHSVKTEPRTSTNNDPTTLKFYDTMWKAILNRAKLLSRLDAVIGNAFPERHVYINQKVYEFITQAIAELKEDGVQPDESFLRKHQHHMSDLLFEDLGTYRSDFKKIARQVIVKHWDWEPSDFDDPQQLADHILELYNDLMEGTKYIHGDCDEEGKFDNFSSAALRDLCVTGYYIGKSSLAASFPDIFGKDLPPGALAFATTALTGALDEYSTGSFAAVKFRHEGYSKVNEQFLDMISNIENVPHRLRSLRRVLKNIAVQGCAKNPAIRTGVVATGGRRNFTAHLD
ncbi:hypothetical protein EDD15DRAFT_2369460 [Pisolithus albus]|nr:hypothetical protein EDD15DRAFT_2369460 [Pisolithus albus]